MRPTFDKLFGCYKSLDRRENLNIGAGFDIDPEFTNADKQLETGANVLWDLERIPSPFNENTFKLVVASHVLEHVYNLMPLMDEIYRILKPGGHLVIFVPYWTSTDAIANPEHVRMFNEHSWCYFTGDQKKNNGKPCSYLMGNQCEYSIEATILAPNEEFEKHPNLDYLIHHEFNIIREMCTVLRAEKNGK